MTRPVHRGMSRCFVDMFSTPGFIQTYAVLLCLGFIAWGNIPGKAADLPVIPDAGAVVVHITDEEDRLMTGQLNPEADAKSHANALYATAMLLLSDLAGNRFTALDELRQVVALDPHCIDAQVRIANLLLQSGQLDPAYAQLKGAAQANPHSADIKSALGYTQKLRGQTEDAVRLCMEALKEDRDQALSMRVLLEMAEEQHDLAGGVLHIEDILKTNNSKAPANAWITLARFYTEIARVDTHPPSDNAMSKTLLLIYQEAAAKAPADVEILGLLADTYNNLGRKQEALKILLQAVALQPFTVEIVLHCAELESDLGHPAEAIKYYEQAYSINQNMSGLRDKLGQLYLDNKRFEDALGLLQDSPPESYLKLAFFELTHSRIKEAGETLAAATARFPNSAKIRFYQAVQYRYAKNYDAALDCLSQVRVLATGPDAGMIDANYYLESALTMNLAGKKDLVQATLNEGLVHFPDNADLMNELAYFWADNDEQLPEALALSKHAAQVEPDNGAIVDTCGWAYFKMDQPTDALPYLQRAAILTNNDPVVLQHLGDVYLKLGRASDAIATWRRGLKNDPGNRDLAGRIDAALAQANDVHLRDAPHQ